MNGPAVTIVPSGGLGVTPTVNGPVFTVVPSGGFAITIMERGGVGWNLEGLTPAIIFREFSMTAGGEGQWVGYSNGIAPQPQPAFGSIDVQPTTTTDLLAFYDDTASGVFLVSFAGDFLDELQGLQLSIGGFVVDSTQTYLVGDTTWLRFTGIPGDLTVGAEYEVLFGFDLPSQQITATPGGFVLNYYNDPGYVLVPTPGGFRMETTNG